MSGKIKGGSWKKNLKKFLSNAENSSQFSFQSVKTGKNLKIQECLYEDLLPYQIKSSPISSLSKEDNVWIACSMLDRISETSDSVVVLDRGYPVGVIGAKEILKNIIKNPQSDFFHKTLSSKIMNRKFYLDTRQVKLSKILEQMQETKTMFSILQNGKYDFSAISTGEILEIGSMSNVKIDSSKLPKRKIARCSRDDSVEDLIKTLLNSESSFAMLEGDSLGIDQISIIKKLSNELNFLENIEEFLELKASIFQFQSPKLIPENLMFSEICRVMMESDFPYSMTESRIWTPKDVLDVLSVGL